MCNIVIRKVFVIFTQKKDWKHHFKKNPLKLCNYIFLRGPVKISSWTLIIISFR